MKKLHLNFGGFYESIHDTKLESYLSCIYDDNFDDVDFSKYQIEYCRTYLKAFENYLLNEFSINIDLNFIKLNSPRFYNFENDKISYSLSEDDIKKVDTLFNQLYQDEIFKEYIKGICTSRDGYIAFYDVNDVLANKNNLMTWLTLDYLSNQFNQSGYFYDFQPDF